MLRGAWLWWAFVEEAFEPEVVDARLRDDGPFADFDADDVHAFAALRALGLPRFDGFVFMREERAEPLVAGLRGGGVKAAVPDSPRKRALQPSRGWFVALWMLQEMCL